MKFAIDVKVRVPLLEVPWLRKSRLNSNPNFSVWFPLDQDKSSRRLIVFEGLSLVVLPASELNPETLKV